MMKNLLMNNQQNFNCVYLKRYIKKFLKDIKIHDKDYYNLIEEKFNKNPIIFLETTMYLIIEQLTTFGQIRRKYLYSLCQCLLYGILNNSINIISMNSSALVKDTNQLREKPQYIQINNISKQLKLIEKRIKIPINYISILPDYSDSFPFEKYENMWKKNIIYLEKMSKVKAYRLSDLYQKDLSSLEKEIAKKINLIELNRIIDYYKHNPFIVLGFSAPANFQENQILSYLKVGVLLEKILPFSILLDVQKKNYPFEQKFYNYARVNKLPIIFCGQTY